MFRIIFLCAVSSVCVNMYAQPLYMPRNVKEAFLKETRSPDGKPGKNYWQNYGRYLITVTALPPDRTIQGTEQITYVNNSPDTLRNPVFRLTMNIHKPGVLRYQISDSNYLTSGMHIDSFSIDGESQVWKANQNAGTWQSVRLPKPLLPKDSIHFSIAWHYTISLQSNREGMLDSTSYFLAYFYPRVAVFDDYNGWDRLDFLTNRSSTMILMIIHCRSSPRKIILYGQRVPYRIATKYCNLLMRKNWQHRWPRIPSFALPLPPISPQKKSQLRTKPTPGNGKPIIFLM